MSTVISNCNSCTGNVTVLDPLHLTSLLSTAFISLRPLQFLINQGIIRIVVHPLSTKALAFAPSIATSIIGKFWCCAKVTGGFSRSFLSLNMCNPQHWKHCPISLPLHLVPGSLLVWLYATVPMLQDSSVRFIIYILAEVISLLMSLVSTWSSCWRVIDIWSGNLCTKASFMIFSTLHPTNPDNPASHLMLLA